MSEFDNTLTRLFADSRETPPPDDFLENVAQRIARARRRRTIKQTALAIASAAVALALTPYVIDGSLAIARQLGAALSSPLTWICSLAIAARTLRRTRRMS